MPSCISFDCKAFQNVSPLPLPFQCQAATAVFFTVNSCKLPPADLPGNVPPLPVLPLAGLHAHLSVLLPSSHPCQLPSLLLPALLLALSMATLPSHRQGKDTLLSPTSRERQKSKKRPKLAIIVIRRYAEMDYHSSHFEKISGVSTLLLLSFLSLCFLVILGKNWR